MESGGGRTLARRVGRRHVSDGPHVGLGPSVVRTMLSPFSLRRLRCPTGSRPFPDRLPERRQRTAWCRLAPPIAPTSLPPPVRLKLLGTFRLPPPYAGHRPGKTPVKFVKTFADSFESLLSGTLSRKQGRPSMSRSSAGIPVGSRRRRHQKDADQLDLIQCPVSDDHPGTAASGGTVLTQSSLSPTDRNPAPSSSTSSRHAPASLKIAMHAWLDLLRILEGFRHAVEAAKANAPGPPTQRIDRDPTG